MTDTYEFLKAQKDAILAEREAEESEWIDAAWKDIQYYRNRIKELEAQLSNQSSGNSGELNSDAADARRYRFAKEPVYQVAMVNGPANTAWIDVDEATYNSARLIPTEYKVRTLYAAMKQGETK